MKRALRAAMIVGSIFAGRPVPAARAVDYVRDVKPILAERCYSCHGAIRQKAGLRLDTAELIKRGGESGPAIEPGQSKESLLIERLALGEKSPDRMPPPSEGVALRDTEIGILRTWIDQGARAPAEAVPPDPRRHWSYIPPSRPAVPYPSGRGWSINPIDAFLAASHQAKGLRAAPPVTKDLLLRRVYLDLVGLPPTRQELHDFRDDRAPDAYEKVVDRLLASPRYGERWGRHWMDVWRYSDWYGLGEEVRFSHPHIWQWREWIIGALNADKGYDRMVVEMLAADELAPGDPAAARATGFLVRNWDIFNRNTWLANTVEHTARAFLGVTIQCARCHDHKFDPIAQTDYYRLRAFFEPVHVRIDRVPGQPDRTKAGLPRVFDDFIGTPTHLFIRGEESRPDKRPLTAATPAVLGGETRIVPVSLPLAASSPDKRDFVIREAIEAGEQAISAARTALVQARQDAAQKTQALTVAAEAESQAQSKYQAALAKPAEVNQTKAAAIAAVGAEARARLDADQAKSQLDVATSSLRLAELRHTALQAVLAAERLEDEGAKQSGSASWAEAAQNASSAQKALAVHEANHNRLVAQRDRDRARLTVERLTASGDPSKDPKLQAAILKISTEVVDATSRLADAKKQQLKADAAAKEKPTTAYTPRALVYHRAKTTFRDQPGNHPYPTVSTGRRLALARWIVDRRNPLTARVAINHIWMRHFGDPLVASPFDFGLRTKQPAHHDLLDWLAVELMESRWSMKHLHRLIVTSQAYQMQSSGGRDSAKNAAIDPDNNDFWRTNVRRMEAEVVRDSLLYVADRLDTRMGGADLPLPTADTVNRRSLYYRYARGDRIPFLVTFDAPSIEECYRRDETIVPQQALALINSGISLARAADVAATIDSEIGDGDDSAARTAFVVSAFERLLGRPPTSAEQAECALALNQLAGAIRSEAHAGAVPYRKARAALVHILINHNDFVSIR